MVIARKKNGVRPADRTSESARRAFETQLAIAIKSAFYDDGKTIGQVVRMFDAERPRDWIIDVIFYRRMIAAEKQTAVFKEQPAERRKPRVKK